MKRGAEFKLIHDARQELTVANAAIKARIIKAQGNKEEQNELIELFEKTGVAEAKLTKIIEAVHAKRFTW